MGQGDPQMYRYRILNFVIVLLDWILFFCRRQYSGFLLWDQVLTMLVSIGGLLTGCVSH